MHGQVRAARESVDGGLDSRDGCSGLCDDLTRFSGLARWCIGLHSPQPGSCSPTLLLLTYWHQHPLYLWVNCCSSLIWWRVAEV